MVTKKSCGRPVAGRIFRETCQDEITGKEGKVATVWV
jgi:hypothetical protein